MAISLNAETASYLTELAGKYRQIVDDLLIRGVRPADIPWGDPRFHDMLLAGIAHMRKYKADADKLAVIREVFGGKS